LSLLRRLTRRRDAQPGLSRFRRIAERELAFLEQEYGFGSPRWEPLPHAEEVLTYERGRTQIQVHLGDSGRGIDLELLTTEGRVEHLQIDDWIQSDDRPWADETGRILGAYARLLHEPALGLEKAVSSG
jgi:hypothetical protein